MSSGEIYASVLSQYSLAAKGVLTGREDAVAKAFGYSEAELSTIPDGANLGLSCGNPLAIAALREGETVIDLGSGAGLDVFLAAEKVGPSGKAIGVDMNEDMISKSEAFKRRSAKENVAFVQSTITEIALEDGIADCIISNCVVNLVPDREKQLVFHEMFRLLKPGGRLAISDILAKKSLPDRIRKSMSLYVGCVAGASQVSEYEGYFARAGFHDVLIMDTKSDLNVYNDPGLASCCEPETEATNTAGPVDFSSNPHPSNMLEEMQGEDLNEWAGSFKIFAIKHT